MSDTPALRVWHRTEDREGPNGHECTGLERESAGITGNEREADIVGEVQPPQ